MTYKKPSYKTENINNKEILVSVSELQYFNFSSRSLYIDFLIRFDNLYDLSLYVNKNNRPEKMAILFKLCQEAQIPLDRKIRAKKINFNDKKMTILIAMYDLKGTVVSDRKNVVNTNNISELTDFLLANKKLASLAELLE